MGWNSKHIQQLPTFSISYKDYVDEEKVDEFASEMYNKVFNQIVHEFAVRFEKEIEDGEIQISI